MSGIARTLFTTSLRGPYWLLSIALMIALTVACIEFTGIARNWLALSAVMLIGPFTAAFLQHRADRT